MCESHTENSLTTRVHQIYGGADEELKIPFNFVLDDDCDVKRAMPYCYSALHIQKEKTARKPTVTFSGISSKMFLGFQMRCSRLALQKYLVKTRGFSPT